ncbi:MAG: cyclic nucleotide-binding domain-containing protein [Verrucomicrobiota bacterium]|jgi:Fe-S-cluster-containing dehydrogenase component/CRP-like cAMP-binding protein
MPNPPPSIDRPQRWDAALDPKMSDATVERLLSTAPFSRMKTENFPGRLPLRDILKNDTRVHACRRGEIVMREGDYGTSAFLVLSGMVRVVLGQGLPAAMLGRRLFHRKNIFKLVAQLWAFQKEPESISVRDLSKDLSASTHDAHGEEVRICLQDVPRILDKHKTALIEGGEFFGEIAALSRMPRTASVFAESEESELLEIRWQGLRDLMKYDKELSRHIDQIYRERALAAALRRIPIFQRLSEETLKKVMAATEFGTYGDYDWSGEYKRLFQSGGPRPQEPVIAEEGDYPNGVLLIQSGFARLSQKFGHGHRTLNYLGAGQIYGLQEIAHNWRKPQSPVSLQYTLRVMGYTHVLKIPTGVMESLVLPEMAPRDLPALLSTAEDRPAAPSPAVDAAEKVGADMLEFLTENRFFNGTATMMIDLDRCTRCDDCVRACAAAHDGNPRFLRHGPISGRLMVANACMHCVDPVCMIGCPTGAIHRYAFGGQVVINPSTCIGCKACFHNCPYEAIRMVEIRDADGDILADQEAQPILKATKCDLCVEQITGPACQQACPHGALARVNLHGLEAFATWLKR